MFREIVYRSGPGQSGTVMEALYCIDGIFICFMVFHCGQQLQNCRHFQGFHVVDTTTTRWFMDETAEGKKKFRFN